MRFVLNPFRYPRWARWTLAGFAGLIVLTTISVEATSRSNFCNSCHIMEPYYSSWKRSSHKDVACVSCHIAPGATNFVHAKLNGLGQVVDDLLYRTSPKPSASVSEFSCTRSGCHTVDTLNGKTISNDTFKFRHDKHLGQKHLGVEITCATCHSHVKGDEHFEVNRSVCVTCHLIGSTGGVPQMLEGHGSAVIPLRVRAPAARNGGASAPGLSQEKQPPADCTACHDPPAGEIEFQGLKVDHARFLSFGATCESCHQGVTAQPPPIEDGRCLQCHSFGVERTLPSHEMHQVHTLGRHKIECFSCHGSIRHGAHVPITSLEKFDCTRCHSDQHVVQRGTYFHMEAPVAGGPDTLPLSPMFLAHVDCTGCHIAPRPISTNAESGATVMAATPESCDTCHQQGFGAKMVPMWQKATRALYDRVESDLRAAGATGADAGAISKARALLQLVRTDGSWGVHNPQYTQRLLEEARAALNEPRGERAP